MKNEKEIKYFSMFTGVGGFELGLSSNFESKIQEPKTKQNSTNFSGNKLERATFSCVGFSENNKYSSELLKNKWADIKNYGDATKINPCELPDFDMLCGGFPCQAFSIAGKRRGFEDTRGTLFFEIARIVKVKRPKIILLENVKGLLNHEKGQTFMCILSTLEELGYNIQWMVLNSKFFGVPQNRERVFIIGSLRGEPKPEILPFGESNRLSSKSREEGQNENRVASAITQNYKRGVHCGGETYAILTPNRKNKRQHGRRFKNPEEEMFTLTKQDIHGVTQHNSIRELTPLEYERLQGFPDNWTKGFSDSQRYKMMGNAVTVNVIKAIAEKLI